MSHPHPLPGPGRRLLIIEDDQRVAAAIAHASAGVGFDFDWKPNLASAYQLARDPAFDLIVLDSDLPDGDGVLFLRALRAEEILTPIVVISTATGVRDRIRGLDAGADDYLSIPFFPRELISRCNSVLRRGRALDLASTIFSNIDFRSDTEDILVNGEPLILPRRLAQLLVALLRNAGRICKRDYLRKVCGTEEGPQPSNALEANVCRLRGALQQAGAKVEIRTLKEVGYLLDIPKRGKRRTRPPRQERQPSQSRGAAQKDPARRPASVG